MLLVGVLSEPDTPAISAQTSHEPLTCAFARRLGKVAAQGRALGSRTRRVTRSATDTGDIMATPATGVTDRAC